MLLAHHGYLMTKSCVNRAGKDIVLTSFGRNGGEMTEPDMIGECDQCGNVYSYTPDDAWGCLEDDDICGDIPGCCPVCGGFTKEQVVVLVPELAGRGRRNHE